MTYRGYTKAQNKATQKYVAKNYDRFVVTIRKDESPSAEVIRTIAAVEGKSANDFIKTAIREKIEANAAEKEMSTDEYITFAKKLIEDTTEANAEAAEMPQEERKPHQPMRLS